MDIGINSALSQYVRLIVNLNSNTMFPEIFKYNRERFLSVIDLSPSRVYESINFKIKHHGRIVRECSSSGSSNDLHVANGSVDVVNRERIKLRAMNIVQHFSACRYRVPFTFLSDLTAVE